MAHLERWAKKPTFARNMPAIPDDKWSTGHGTLGGGKPVRFTVNRALDSLLLSGTHPFEVRFTVDILDRDTDGLPASKSELDFLYDFEARLKNGIALGGNAYLGVTTSLDGLRDIVFYSKNPDAVIRFFEDEIRPTAERNVELTVEENGWKLYRLFTDAE